MAFTKTTASNLEDALSQMCAFAVAHAGFTSEGNLANNYRISKGGMFWSFASSFTGGLNHAVGRMSYSIGAGYPSEVNGQYGWTSLSAYGFAGPYPSLYLFTEGSCVFMVIELTTGVFSHMCFGNIDKLDTFEGGEFLSATFMDTRYSSNSILYYYGINYSNSSTMFTGGSKSVSNNNTSYMRYVQASGKTNNADDWASFGGNRSSKLNNVIGSSWSGFSQVLFERSPNTATGRSILIPQNIFSYDYVLNNGNWNFSGSIPGIRVINIENLDAAEVILNDWQVFPMCSKDGNNINYPVTSGYGFAYKRVP